jgi:hypothetical protein
MTQTEIEAYDAMMADRDSWKERFLRLAKEKALCPSDATACSAAPGPWSFDVSPQETPPARRNSTIYAADSTRICDLRGEHAEALARLIVKSVNHCLPNV